MTIAASKQFSAVERYEAVKLIFELHGNDLATTVAMTYIELCERCAALEARLEKLEARRK